MIYRLPSALDRAQVEELKSAPEADSYIMIYPCGPELYGICQPLLICSAWSCSSQHTTRKFDGPDTLMAVRSFR